MTETTLSRHSAQVSAVHELLKRYQLIRRNSNEHSTIKIPFANEAHATIAKRAILVDRELNAHLVERTMSVEGSVLVV
jgi:hypothetical protein